MKRFCLLFAVLTALVTELSAQPTTAPIHIWDGTPVHAHGVTLTPYLPEGTEGATAVIICPGGSYFWLDADGEGEKVARWLQDQGLAAFLLQYRTGGWFDFVFGSRLVFRGNRFPDMVEDLQRSIQLVREDASGFGVDPGKVGVMGFSAGGHLVMTSAELADTDFLADRGIVCEVPLCPDFVAPIYPVVTLEEREGVHRRSRRGLLGEGRERDQQLRDLLSLEKNVSELVPPVFLLNCKDDPVVDYRNSEMLDSALTANKIPHLYVQYETGGHGFGADETRFSEETKHWQETFLDWITKLFLNDED